MVRYRDSESIATATRVNSVEFTDAGARGGVKESRVACSG